MLRRRELTYLTTILAVVFVLAYVLSLPSSAFAAKKTTPKEESKEGVEPPAAGTLETPAAAETKTAPSESDRQRNLINGYIGAGDNEKAIQALKDVAISSREFSDLTDWVNIELWRLASAKGEIQKSIEDLENAAAKDPKNTGLKRIIAGGYERLYRWDKVVSIYEDLLNSNPSESTLNTRLLVYYMLAGDYNKVIAKLEPVVNTNPNDTYHSDILANAYVRARMETKALALYKQKIDKDPDSAGLRGRYAQAFMDFGRFQEAAKEWKRASELAPSSQFFKQKEAEALSLK